jgi:Putative bacterial sensory transduction regulator
MTPVIDESAVDQAALDASMAVSLIDEIEAVISSLDHSDSAMVNRGENGRLWKFQYGSVEVFVQVTGMKPEDTFTTWASLLPLPAKNEAKLMRQVLEMNWLATLDAKFAIMGNRIVIAMSRPVADLSASEISRAITLVATIADDYDDVFKAEYGN